jgi:hypothetical protein
LISLTHEILGYARSVNKKFVPAPPNRRDQPAVAEPDYFDLVHPLGKRDSLGEPHSLASIADKNGRACHSQPPYIQQGYTWFLDDFVQGVLRRCRQAPGLRRAAVVAARRERAPYIPGSCRGGASEAPFPSALLGIEGLSPDDINHVLDLADGHVERQAQKKRCPPRGRTIIDHQLPKVNP